MKNTNKKYAKLMLAGALSFSFVAEATNYTLTENSTHITEIVSQASTKKWEKQLLGPYHKINTLTAANVREAYTAFLTNVRAQHNNWTDTEWDHAKAVLDKLDYKKNTLESQLKLDDKGKIKMLQAEFRALETGDDIKD
ncbi:hypothetical protein [Pontibacter oryzae]|uniref:Uncharacterized protein n=1 Tax=Pontibacter oryzae TaxID=2304593 RepID=A0A399SKU2_9BACT|nr:hypothetical protein [Pontibacter oryzae]RIJ43083.1 hypothetical protein D1627_04435 [Pontibacter oryzae]